MPHWTERTQGRLRTTIMLPIALPIVATVRLALNLTHYARLAEWMPKAVGVTHPRWAHAASRAVQITARVIPGASCLTQAIAARAMLTLIGHQSWIRIGVRRDDDGAIMAHAWLVDARNRILIGGTRAELARFQPLADIDRPAQT